MPKSSFITPLHPLSEDITPEIAPLLIGKQCNTRSHLSVTRKRSADFSPALSGRVALPESP